jgi:hypothetical protein
MTLTAHLLPPLHSTWNQGNVTGETCVIQLRREWQLLGYLWYLLCVYHEKRYGAS